MKRNLIYLTLFWLLSILFISCDKARTELLIPYPNDITFEDQELDRFSFKIPNAPFKSGDAASGVITANVINNGDGTFSGFAVSNKNWRSYPWNLSPDFAPATLSPEQLKMSLDSCIFSVYTSRPNYTKNFLVGRVDNGDAFIRLDKPSVVEHVLVANTTYNFLLANYGSTYSDAIDVNTQLYLLTGAKVRNIQNPNSSTAMYGRFTLPGPDGTNLIRLAGDEILAKRAAGKSAADAARLAGKSNAVIQADSTAAAKALSKGYVKLTISGYVGETITGNVDFYLAIRPNVDPLNPTLNYILPDWNKVDLSTLGVVDKIAFDLSSSYMDANGKMLIPPYFCLDGIRLKK